MAVTNLYPNLPGHLVVFKDGGLSMRGDNAVNASGKSLLIIGTSIDGPVNEPVAVDIENIDSVFGEDYFQDDAGNHIPNGTTLVKYARQAYAAGFEDIRCMRVTGSQASAKLVASTKVKEEIVAMTPITFVANGNDKIEDYTIDFTSLSTPVGAGETPIISDVTCSYGGSITVGTTDSHYPDPAKININANMVPARGAITYNGIVTRVANTPKVLSESDGITIADTGTTDTTSGDCIIEVSVPASKVTDFYEYLTTGGVLDSDNKDKHGISPVTALTEFNASTPDSLYGEITLKVAGTAIPLDTASGIVTEITKDATSGIKIKYIETGSAGTTAITGTETIEFTYRGINAPAGGTGPETVVGTIQVQDYYTLIELTPEKLPEITEGVVLLGADDTQCADLTTAGVITYDSTAGTFKVDLSKIPSTVNVTSFMIGTNMKLGYKHKEITTVTEEIVFQSIFGGAVYNESQVIVEKITNKDGVEGRLITLKKPDSKKLTDSEQPMKFSSFDYPTFGTLKTAIENKAVTPLNNIFEVVTNSEDTRVDSLEIDPTAGILQEQFKGGTDGVNPTNDEYFVALSGERNEEGYLVKQGAYQILENYSVDFIYLAGVYSDSTVSEKVSKIPQPFHHEFAMLCAVLTYRTNMTHGFIDVKPNSNTTLIGIQNWVDKLMNLPNTFLIRDYKTGEVVVDDKKNPMDIGWYTSCIVGPQPVCQSDTIGTYYGSAAIAYAALTASIKVQSGTTNKKVPGCTRMRFKLSNKQMDMLTKNRMVCFKYKNEGRANATTTPYVVDGCTCSLPDSDYKRISTVKVVKEAVDNVRDVCDPYIGEPNTVEQRNAMSTAISKRLTNLKKLGIITYYDFEVQATNVQVLLGECTIALTIVAPQELRKITTVVALKAAM